MLSTYAYTQLPVYTSAVARRDAAEVAYAPFLRANPHFQGPLAPGEKDAREAVERSSLELDRLCHRLRTAEIESDPERGDALRVKAGRVLAAVIGGRAAPTESAVGADDILTDWRRLHGG